MKITITIDGQNVEAEDGEPLAALLLRQSTPVVRHHPVDGSPRSPYCMMGVCFECLVEVDGKPSQQACLIGAKDKMVINRGLK